MFLSKEVLMIKIDELVRKRYLLKRRTKMAVMIIGSLMVVIGAGMVIWSILYTGKKYDEKALSESIMESEIVEIPVEELPNDIPEEEKEEIIDKIVEVGETYPATVEEIETAILKKEDEDIFKDLYEDLPDFDGYLDITLSHELQVEVFADCDIYGVPYSLALALMETESSFREDIGNEDVLGGEEGGARYYGYMQLSIDNCLKAEEYGLNAHTPEGNIEMGIKILGNLLLDYDEEWEAITAYKGGTGYLQSCKAKGIIPETTKNVLAKKAKYEAMINGE